MENKKQHETSPFLLKIPFIVRDEWFFFILIFVAALFAAVLIPVAVYFSLTWLIYLTAALIFVALVSSLLVLRKIAAAISKEVHASLAALSTQIREISSGSLKFSSAAHLLPSFDILQKEINGAVQYYSRYELVNVGHPLEPKIEKEILEGYVFPFGEFKTILFREIQRNYSYRSAFLFIELMGVATSDEKGMAALGVAIQKAFPGAMIGRYDAKTFSVYVFAVDSVLSLQTKAERLVSSFNELRLVSSIHPTVVYCRLGGAIYPYSPMTDLISDAKNALAESQGVKLVTSLKGVYYPQAILSDSNKRTVYLASMENFEHAFLTASSATQEIDVLKTYIKWMVATCGYDVGGILLYDKTSQEYRLLFEEGRNQNDKAFSRLGDRIAPEAIDPLYRAAAQDLSFVGSSSDDLPSSLANALLNLGIRSFYFSALSVLGDKTGFLYLTSKTEKAFSSLSSQEDLASFSSLAAGFVAAYLGKREAVGSESLLSAVAERRGAYVYTIDRATHRLTYLSKNLSLRFPLAHVGDVCYKVLRTAHAAPCSHCPLVKGADHRIIQNISSLESFVSVLEYRGANDDLSTIIIEPSAPTRLSAGGDLLDDALLIKNSRALSVDLSREIRVENTGFIVAIELCHRDELLAKLPGADSSSIMSLIVHSFQDAGYGDVMYRFSDYGLAFLLKAYTRAKIMVFVEEAAEILSAPLSIKDVTVQPAFAYSAIAYPSEASTSRQFFSLARSELSRSSLLGDGYLVEVANRHPRKALRSDYVLSVLKDTLASGGMPIHVQPLVAAENSKIVGADIRAGLYGPDKMAIPPAEFIPLAEKENLVSKVDLCSLTALGLFYENYAYSIFQSTGIKRLEMYLSLASLTDPAFPFAVRKAFSRYKFPRSFLTFEIASDLFLTHESDIRRTIEALSPLAISVEAVDYDPTKVPLSALRPFGIYDIKTERSLIWNAAANPGDLADFSRFAESAIRQGFALTVAGIENDEEKDLARRLGAKRLQGYAFGHPMGENDFIKLLNYGK